MFLEEVAGEQGERLRRVGRTTAPGWFWGAYEFDRWTGLSSRSAATVAPLELASVAERASTGRKWLWRVSHLHSVTAALWLWAIRIRELRLISTKSDSQFDRDSATELHSTLRIQTACSQC